MKKYFEIISSFILSVGLILSGIYIMDNIIILNKFLIQKAAHFGKLNETYKYYLEMRNYLIIIFTTLVITTMFLLYLVIKNLVLAKKKNKVSDLIHKKLKLEKQIEKLNIKISNEDFEKKLK